ncbi:MAG: DUF2073 domain-containing protein [Candidatus Thermoplasmatota archaeon]
MGKKQKNQEISFTLISRKKLNDLSSEEKLTFILKEVKKGNILVLEHGLTSGEQTDLIENTMKEIDQDTFIGVEMQGYQEEKPSFLQKILGKNKKPRITLIGPANLVKTIKKDNNVIQTKIIAGKGS